MVAASDVDTKTRAAKTGVGKTGAMKTRGVKTGTAKRGKAASVYCKSTLRIYSLLLDSFKHSSWS